MKELHLGAVAAWSPGDEPHGESIDLDEYPVALLEMKKCRSFRADLFHKLTLIIRAHGGHGQKGFYLAARRLQVNRHTLRRWLRWDTSPRNRVTLERIDNAYSDALELLTRRKLAAK